MLAGPPPGDVEVPPLVVEIAEGDTAAPVWLNQLGGLTFEVGSGPDRRYVKWSAHGSGVDLCDEAIRLDWVGAHVRVPRVLLVRSDDIGTVLVTTPVPGRSAVAAPWAARPELAVRAIGVGLRHLHDHAPVDRCPFSAPLDQRITHAAARVAAGETDPSAWHSEHAHLTTRTALAHLGRPPEIDRAVVRHGDACAPNTIVDAGAWSGLVDLGALGVANRWSDLAIATWSTTWNYGPGWEGLLLDAYGVAPDAARIAYYRLLWDLT